MLVDDNNRVHKGDVLVQLDKEPYQIQLALKKAPVECAQADLAAAEDRLRGVAGPGPQQSLPARARDRGRGAISWRCCKSNVAQLKAEQANLVLAEQDFARGQKLVGSGAISKQQFDQYKAALDVAQNRVKSAEQTIQQTRASLGLPIEHGEPVGRARGSGSNLFDGAPGAGGLVGERGAAGCRSVDYDGSPKQVIEEFYKRDPEGDFDTHLRPIARRGGADQAGRRPSCTRPKPIWLRPS